MKGHYISSGTRRQNRHWEALQIPCDKFPPGNAHQIPPKFKCMVVNGKAFLKTCGSVVRWSAWTPLNSEVTRSIFIDEYPSMGFEKCINEFLPTRGILHCGLPIEWAANYLPPSMDFHYLWHFLQCTWEIFTYRDILMCECGCVLSEDFARYQDTKSMSYLRRGTC